MNHTNHTNHTKHTQEQQQLSNEQESVLIRFLDVIQSKGIDISDPTNDPVLWNWLLVHTDQLKQLAGAICDSETIKKLNAFLNTNIPKANALSSPNKKFGGHDSVEFNKSLKEFDRWYNSEVRSSTQLLDDDVDQMLYQSEQYKKYFQMIFNGEDSMKTLFLCFKHIAASLMSNKLRLLIERMLNQTSNKIHEIRYFPKFKSEPFLTVDLWYNHGKDLEVMQSTRYYKKEDDMKFAVNDKNVDRLSIMFRHISAKNKAHVLIRLLFYKNFVDMRDQMAGDDLTYIPYHYNEGPSGVQISQEDKLEKNSIKHDTHEIKFRHKETVQHFSNLSWFPVRPPPGQRWQQPPGQSRGYQQSTRRQQEPVAMLTKEQTDLANKIIDYIGLEPTNNKIKTVLMKLHPDKTATIINNLAGVSIDKSQMSNILTCVTQKLTPLNVNETIDKRSMIEFVKSCIYSTSNTRLGGRLQKTTTSFIRTEKHYITKDGKKRRLYTRNGKMFLKQKTASGTYVYKPVPR